MGETQMKAKGGSFLISSLEANDLFTPEDFTDEQKMIGQTARQFIEKEVEPHNEAIENQDIEKIVSLLQQAGDLGLLAHSIPEAYGGLGLDKVSKGLVGEIVGKSGGYGVAHSNHTCIATLPITYFGTKEQKEKYLPKMASGEYLGAYCLTEPSSGSDALAAKTTATLNEEGTHYLLNGTKLYITNAVFSQTFIVYAKVDGDKFTAFIVEKDFPGLSLGPEEKKMGIKGSSTRSVIFEDCRVPVENVLGEIGKGHVIALNVLNLGRFNLGSACMGGAKSALALGITHTNERKQFGKRIAEFGATKEKVAKMAARIYAAETLQYRTADLLESALDGVYDTEDKGLVSQRLMEFALECAICKVYGSETLDYVVDESLQLHGGAGFIKEYRIEQAYRDSRINRIFEGTNEINRLLVPGIFFKKATKGELPALEAVNQAIERLKTGAATVEGGELLAERQAVQSIRDTYLALAGLAYQKFGAKLDNEQELVMKLADIGIELFAAESAVLRSQKALERNGSDKERLKEQLAKLVTEEALLKVQTLAREFIGGLEASTESDGLLSLITNQLGSYRMENRVARFREIASYANESGQYTC
ncbi:acyl-CoA dehydrogenase family protein [Alkalihalobacterium chitinilyticum]|uniref:Acyl-CoA dehydrogenase family protein n=1 Tax=Alkalihalobacterium chitinilyticum TaxID=2980103 RepID=A0ABT5VEX4_9BACI|nr:acyl-CoA dehydrogenase family protein [Alkalihalobacterium chitinilyticum]MDE5413882.1 acyl-CoA dehydrogenase family protein [Alkalihalobacterium chitinilyticum]